MRSLISPLPSVINAWLNGQLVLKNPQGTEFLDLQQARFSLAPVGDSTATRLGRKTAVAFGGFGFVELCSSRMA